MRKCKNDVHSRSVVEGLGYVFSFGIWISATFKYRIFFSDVCVCLIKIIIIICLVSNLVNCHLIDERCQKKINVTPGSH